MNGVKELAQEDSKPIYSDILQQPIQHDNSIADPKGNKDYQECPTIH
jgi:hypothetical protein